MKKWELIKELAKGTGFYTKQFIFIALVFVTIFGSISILKHQKFKAESNDFIINGTSANKEIAINIDKRGQIIREGKLAGRIELSDGYDILRYKVLNRPEINIDNLIIKVHFDEALPKDRVVHRPICNHIQLTDSSQCPPSQIVDDHTITYTGTSLSPITEYTVYGELPKGFFKPPIQRLVAHSIANLGINFWLIFAFLMPAITFITLASILIRRNRNNRHGPVPDLSTPPEKIPPAVLGVLVHGRIGPREIAATILDLAERNYLHIYQDGENFYFGRGQGLESDKIYELYPFERLLLSKIFLPNSHKTSAKDLNIRLGEQLFSEKMAQVFLEIYNQAEKYEFFEENPALVHQKYKYYGGGLLFGGLAGFILNAIFNKGDSYLLFFWVGMILSAVAIIRIGLMSGMPLLTEKGKIVQGQWLGFKNFINQIDMTKIASFHQGNADMYVNYLPYAIILDAEKDWTLRFVKDPFYMPRWYDSSAQIVRLEDFANSLFPIIAYISHNLIVSRAPVID